MNRTAISCAVFGVYLVVAGAGFLFIPNMILPIFRLPTTTEVWIRALGLVVAVLGGYYLYFARQNVVPFFRATVPGRLVVAFGLVAFVILDLSGPALLMFAILDGAGAIWTWSSMRVVSESEYRTA